MQKKREKVYILHGWAVDEKNAQKWQPLVSALAGVGIEAEVLKIPGLSSQLDEVWNIQNYVDWVDTQLAHEHEIILLGHSFGGQIACKYVAQHPAKVKKLILIDSAGIRPKSLLAQLKRGTFWVAAKVGKIFSQSEQLRKILYTLAREHDYQSASPILRQTMAQVLKADVTRDLPKIHCSTLIIWGSDDRVTPLSLGQIFHILIPKNQFQVIVGARHSPQFTAVEEVTKIISQFVESEKC